jgi:hypothetical protein
MFTRAHRIGRHVYTEALESYRDPDTGRPWHRCVRDGGPRARSPRRWAGHTGKSSRLSVAYWQGILDRTVRPKFWKQIKRAPENLKLWRRRLDTARTHLAALTAARGAGLPADGARASWVMLAAKGLSALCWLQMPLAIARPQEILTGPVT